MNKLAVLGCLVVAAQVAVAGLVEKIAEKHQVISTDVWYGHERVKFDFDGRVAWVVKPSVEPRADRAWTWTMQWAEAYVERTGVPDLLKRGFHHVTIDLFDMRMDEKGLAAAAAFQAYLVEELGFAPKANLIGMSWGGFFSTRYAAKFPLNVAKIYLDAPLLTFDRFGGNEALTPTEAAAKIGPWAFDGPADGDWSADPRMPVNMAGAIAAAKIPVCLLYGGQDQTVNPRLNCERFAADFKAAGGLLLMENRSLYGHHPHGFEHGDIGKLLEYFAAPQTPGFQFDEIVDKRILVLGDSIAQAGGWLSDIRYYLAKRYPDKDIDFTNIGLASEGLSGYSPYERHEKIHGFPNPWIVTRLDSALRKLNPEVVVLMYGMNDSYEEVYARGAFPMFKNGFERVLIACRERGVKKIIVLTPTPYGDFAAPKEKYLSDYSAWLLSRTDPDVTVVDLHGRFKALVMSRGEAYAPDKVHPNAKYHFEMAKIVLAAGGINVSADDSAESISRDPLWKSVDALQRMQDDCTRRWVGYTREAVFAKPERYTPEEQERRAVLRRELGHDVCHGHP